MTRTWLLMPVFVLGFALIARLGASAPPSNAGLGAPTSPGEEETGCVAPVGWFQPGGTKEASYTTDLDPDNDCDFYRFAWQTFLFVTGPDQGETQPRFLKFATPDEVFGESSGLAFPKKRKKGDLVLSPRVRKPKGVRDIDTVFQAISNGIVVDQNGRPLYYGLHMNDAFVTFVKKNNLTTPDGIGNASKTLMFEPGCVEFKSSWRVVGEEEDTSNVITRMATLPTLVMTDNKLMIDADHPRDEKVALVGLHVVGVAKGHPEFIWATFEHLKNAPDLPVDLINISRTDPSTKPAWDAPVTDKSWTFCPKDTHAIQCNVQNNDPDHPVQLNADKQTLSPVTPIFRHYAFGGDNPRGVVSMNASVHEKLPAGDVRKNYEMIGAVWLDRPLDRDGEPGTFVEGHPFGDELLAGATKLSSSTMETFTQNTNSQRNCFGCHDTTPQLVTTTTPNIILKGARINVSHMILRAFTQGRQMEALKKQKDK